MEATVVGKMGGACRYAPEGYLSDAAMCLPFQCYALGRDFADLFVDQAVGGQHGGRAGGHHSVHLGP